MLEFYAQRDEPQTEGLLELWSNVGRQMGRVIERERYTANIRGLSVTDELTGLYNRRGFVDLVRQELAATHGPRALVLADIDGLKRVNDEFWRRAHRRFCGAAAPHVLAQMISWLGSAATNSWSG